MTLAFLAISAVLCGALVLTSYIERLFAESGKLLSREFQENVEAFEDHVEARLGGRDNKSRRRLASSIGLLTQMLTAAISLLLAYLVFHGRNTTLETVQLVVAIILILVAFNRVIPFLLFTRTRGDWLVRFAPVVRALLILISPVTLVLSFCMQVAALAEEPQAEQPDTHQEAVEALIEAGEEEGILEESDRELITSVVEFGDLVTREVMTARPEIVAVPITTTIEQLTEIVRERRKSRIPVYEETLDTIRGIVYTHDLLQVADTEAATRTVATLLRPAYFVPEYKKTSELLREMQQKKIQIAIVIDEYGSVAGVVTIEDLLEEIVGELHDERETGDIEREDDETYIVPGSLDIDRLEELFGVYPQEKYEATTVGGLLTERLGRIPQAGELFEEDGLRFDVLQSTDRRVEKVRVSRATQSASEADNEVSA